MTFIYWVNPITISNLTFPKLKEFETLDTSPLSDFSETFPILNLDIIYSVVISIFCTISIIYIFAKIKKCQTKRKVKKLSVIM